MARFETAKAIVNKFEGGYANNEFDRGGETYRGISRNANPGWEGWNVIDNAKRLPDFSPSLLNNNQSLIRLSDEFFKREYWDVWDGDKWINQNAANEMFEQSVHFGVKQAVNHLQRSLNLLNKYNDVIPDLIPDGVYGSKTSMALRVYLAAASGKTLINLMNGFQIKRYLETMELNPTQRKWRGWFNRVEINFN